MRGPRKCTKAFKITIDLFLLMTANAFFLTKQAALYALHNEGKLSVTEHHSINKRY